MKKRHVLLLGRSLLLSGLAVSLEESTAVHVELAAAWAEAKKLLAEHVPDVVIFDLADAGESQLLPVLCENPHLVLVGLDTERNRAMLLAGKETSALTLDGVRGIVEGTRP